MRYTPRRARGRGAVCAPCTLRVRSVCSRSTLALVAVTRRSHATITRASPAVTHAHGGGSHGPAGDVDGRELATVARSGSCGRPRSRAPRRHLESPRTPRSAREVRAPRRPPRTGSVTPPAAPRRVAPGAALALGSREARAHLRHEPRPDGQPRTRDAAPVDLRHQHEPPRVDPMPRRHARIIGRGPVEVAPAVPIARAPRWRPVRARD